MQDLPTDRRIRIYRYFRVIYERSAHEAYKKAVAYTKALDSSSAEGREELRAISGFRKVDSLTDVGYNIVLGFFIVGKKLLSAVAETAWGWSQKASVCLSDVALKSDSKKVRLGLGAAADILSADRKRTMKTRYQQKHTPAVVEIAVWINGNFERNLYLFRRLYGDEFLIEKEEERFYRVFAILVIVAESVSIPPDAGYVKGYYYYER